MENYGSLVLQHTSIHVRVCISHPGLLLFHCLHHTCSLSAHQHTSRSLPAVSHRIKPPAPCTCHQIVCKVRLFSTVLPEFPEPLSICCCLSFLCPSVASALLTLVLPHSYQLSPDVCLFFPVSLKTVTHLLVSTSRKDNKYCALYCILAHITAIIMHLHLILEVLEGAVLLCCLSWVF